MIFNKGQLLTTPENTPFIFKNEILAQKILAEWCATPSIKTHKNKPLTMLWATAKDRMPEIRAQTITNLIQFAKTDTLLYWEAHDPKLVEVQNLKWRNIFQLIEDRFKITLNHSFDLSPLHQPFDTATKLDTILNTLNSFSLTALQSSAGLLRSVYLGLLMTYQYISAKEAFELSFLGELYQMSRWGIDEEAKERLDAIGIELEYIEEFIALSSSE